MSDFSICPDPDHREALHDDRGPGNHQLPLVSVLRHVAFILALIFVCRNWQTLI